MRRLLRRLLRPTPARIALVAASLVAADSLLPHLEPIGDCRPFDRLYGYCDPVDGGTLLIFLAGQFAVVFGLALVVALILRTMVRAITRPSHESRRRAAAVIVAIAIFAAGIGADRLVLEGTPAAPDDFALIRDAWDLLHAEYVRSADLDDRWLAYAAIDAMVDAVGDTDHTYFSTPDEVAETNAMLQAEEAAEGSVDWAMVPGSSLALIRIDVFSDGVSDVLAATVEDVGRARASGIILDLRGNPGGFADEAVWVASEFLGSGDVLGVRDAWGDVRTAPVEGPVVAPTTPLVVLIDADSASAAEVVASALQDAGRATLIGRTTAGTGTILDSYTLGDGSELSIGTREWLTRDGRSVWHVGVRPELTVEMPGWVRTLTPAILSTLDAAGLRRWGDAQLMRAIAYLEVTILAR